MHTAYPELRSTADFATYAKPYADMAMRCVRERHPDIPIVYYANGGSSYLELQRDMACDVVSLDWAVDMADARAQLGPSVPVQGNVDPSLLLGSVADIDDAVKKCIDGAGGPGKHILNLGHGVLQPTPEANVAAFVDAARKHGTK
mgnify:CR=1 FL=1